MVDVLTVVEPMLATEDSVERLSSSAWAFEGKHDGNRMVVRVSGGQARLQSRSGRDVTGEYRIAFPDLPDMVLDGEAVVLAGGAPDFNAIQNRASAGHTQFWAFDVLEVEGTDLCSSPYATRRRVLDLLADKYGLCAPAPLDAATGADAMRWAEEHQWEGVVAKRLDSPYSLGRRSRDWLKQKRWQEAEVVIGGWKHGKGNRSDRIGNLLMGERTDRGLRFAGRVGTGFSDAELARLAGLLAPIAARDCPFYGIDGADARDAHWVEPLLVAEVRYQSETVNGHLRHPSWRGVKGFLDAVDERIGV